MSAPVPLPNINNTNSSDAKASGGDAGITLDNVSFGGQSVNFGSSPIKDLTKNPLTLGIIALASIAIVGVIYRKKG